MHEGDQHLIGVEVAVQRDAADVLVPLWGTEITKFGVSRLLELQLETRARIGLHHHGHGCGREITLQYLKLFVCHTAKILFSSDF